MLSSWRMYEMHLALFLKAGCDNILQAIEQTTPSASASKATKLTDVEATATVEGEKLATTLSEIDKLISDVAVEKEVVTSILDKGKEIDKTSLE
jgi:hypothetical protein